MYGEELKEIYGQPLLFQSVTCENLAISPCPLASEGNSRKWTVRCFEEVLRNRFQFDTTLRFLDVKLPGQQALCCFQLSLGEFEDPWAGGTIGRCLPLASLASSHLTRCFLERPLEDCPQHPYLHPHPRLSEKSPICLVSAAPRRCQFQCVCILVWGLPGQG